MHYNIHVTGVFKAWDDICQIHRIDKKLSSSNSSRLVCLERIYQEVTVSVLGVIATKTRQCVSSHI
jgi:hypothetical protein